jgi:hypothetical protein
MFIWFVIVGSCLSTTSPPSNYDLGVAAVNDLCHHLFFEEDDSRLPELCLTIYAHLSHEEARTAFASEMFGWYLESRAPLALEVYAELTNTEFDQLDDWKKESLYYKFLKMGDELESVC